MKDISPFSEMTQLAVEAVFEAGAILRGGFGTKYTKSLKPGVQNYVTEFDHASELCIISKIKKKYPTHAFLAEESGASANFGAEILWIIDPLDGTTNFAHNIPLFCISVAALGPDGLECGVIYQPMTEELYIAEKGKGAYLNNVKVHVSLSGRFAGGVGATGFPRNIHENPLNCVNHFMNVLNQGTIIRNLGSSALNMAYVSSGCFDAYWAVSLHPWDIAAGVLLIQEAGGKVTTYGGESYHVLSGSPIVATNQLVHLEVLSYLYP